MVNAAFVLVVDEEPAVRRLIRAILEQNHLQVLEAAGAQAAIDLYKAHSEEVALLLTDVRLSDVDGNELVRRIRAIRPTQRVMFVTGYPDEVDKSITRLQPLPKPFSAAELLDKVFTQIVRAAAAN